MKLRLIVRPNVRVFLGHEVPEARPEARVNRVDRRCEFLRVCLLVEHEKPYRQSNSHRGDDKQHDDDRPRTEEKGRHEQRERHYGRGQSEDQIAPKYVALGSCTRHEASILPFCGEGMGVGASCRPALQYRGFNIICATAASPFLGSTNYPELPLPVWRGQPSGRNVHDSRQAKAGQCCGCPALLARWYDRSDYSICEMQRKLPSVSRNQADLESVIVATPLSVFKPGMS